MILLRNCTCNFSKTLKLNESKISVRYAKAFFSSALEGNRLEGIKKDVDLLLDLLNSEPRFKELLSSPVVSTRQKSETLNAIFKGRVNGLTVDFLQLLLKNHREMFLLEMCLNFRSFYGKHTGIRAARLVTAVETDAQLLAKFSELIMAQTGSIAGLTTVVDENIIGGFILTIDDKQLDASIATQLKRMKRELVNVIKN